MSSKVKQAKELIYNVMKTIDKTGLNYEKYKKLFDSMNEKELETFLKKLVNNDNEFLYLECMPYKNEPKLEDVEDAAKVLGLPLMEYVYHKDTLNGKPIRTSQKAMVGYLHIKRVRMERFPIKMIEKSLDFGRSF